MKRGKSEVAIILGIVIIVGIIIVCWVNKDKTQMDLEKNIYDSILEDNFSSDSKIENKMQEEIAITIDKVDDESIIVEIEAPYIADELFAWIDLQDAENVTPEDVEEKILSLISELPKEKKSYELYYKNDEKIEISYTQECRDTLSCGMLEFYNMAMQMVIEEMKEGEH